MITGLFRTNQGYASLLLFVYAVLLQLPLVLGERPVAFTVGHGASYYGDKLLAALATVPKLALLLAPLLVAATGYLANVAADRYRMAGRVTQFPGLFLMLLWALSPAFRPFSLLHLTQLFVVLALLALGHTYRGKTVAVATFNAGWWLGLAVLLDPAHLLYLPAFVVGIGLFQSAGLRSVSQLLVGMACPLFLGGVYAYWRGDLLPGFTGFSTGSTGVGDAYALLGTVLLVIPLTAVLLAGPRRTLLSIEGKKNVSFLYWLLLFSLPVALVGDVALHRAQVAVPALGMLFGLWLVERPSVQVRLWHLFIFAGALVLCLLVY